MVKCVKISCHYDATQDFLNKLQKAASKLALEGSLQLTGSSIKIVICGNKDHIDQFVDILYNELARKKAPAPEVEPFIKEKDYRGVFRIIK